MCIKKRKEKPSTISTTFRGGNNEPTCAELNLRENSAHGGHTMGGGGPDRSVGDTSRSLLLPSSRGRQSPVWQERLAVLPVPQMDVAMPTTTHIHKMVLPTGFLIVPPLNPLYSIFKQLDNVQCKSLCTLHCHTGVQTTVCCDTTYFQTRSAVAHEWCISSDVTRGDYVPVLQYVRLCI